MTDVREAALWWARAGFCVLPTKHHDKAPAVNTWRQYVKTKGSVSVPAAPSPQIVDRWFAGEQSGLGLILGATSGNAEMFEFEGRAIAEGLFVDFGAFAETNGAGEVWERLKKGYVEKTPSGGLHFVFRVTGGPALGNTRLAARPSSVMELADHPDQPIQVLIETRGEGGFVVIAPSTMPGRAWCQTGHGDIVTLTVEERDHLYAVARMFDAVPEYVRKEVVAREKQEGQVSPLDDFRARTDWADILEPQGWTHVGLKSDGRDAWLRPGKDFSEGWGLSATTGNTDGRSDSLYIFSTSSDLPALTGLSKEFVWAHYNAGGDISEAARNLREQGYGSGAEASQVVAGDTNPFSDGFDPMAWAEKRARENAVERSSGPVPTVKPTASDFRADDAGGEVASEGDTETPADHAEGEFQALDWRALAGEDYVEDWVVEGFLGARRAMALYSAPKLGKSLLMLEMAARVSRGDSFMGRATTQKVVLYFDHENDPRSDTWPRLRAMGFTPEQLDGLKVLSFPQMATLDTEAGGTALMRAVAQFDAGLVIIDTVSRTIAGDENENDTWLKFFAWTGRALKRAEIPYVRLDHSGKDETKGQRGGSAKSGDVDVICQLTRAGKREFLLRMDGSRQKLEYEAIGFRRLEGPLRSEPLGLDVDEDKQGVFDRTVKARIKIADRIIEELKLPDGQLTLPQMVRFGVHTTEGRAEAKGVIDGMVNSGRILQIVDGKSTVYELNREWVLDPSFGAPDDQSL